MKSIRITNLMSDNIMEAILNDAYKARLDALAEERFAFSEKVYADLYDEQIRKKIEALPKGWLPERKELFAQFGNTSMGYCRRVLREPKRFLDEHAQSGRCLKIYDHDHPFTQEHDDITARLEALKSEIQKTRLEVRAIVKSCTTTKQLKSTWPEIAKYVERFEPAENRCTAVALVNENLNQKLGLNAAAAEGGAS